MGKLKAQPDWLRANATAPALGVDREAGIIRGYVVAQEGSFKSEDRGRFNQSSLRRIVDLMNAAPSGLKSRFAHPTLSSDGLGKFLGRARNPRLSGDRVRADLHLDPTSRKTPHGDLGGYVMDLAESDPDAFSSSLSLKAEKEYELDRNNRPIRSPDGEELPRLWIPTELHASDVVDTGDAVDGFLSAEGLPDSIVRQGAAFLDEQFPGEPREVVEARCLAWLQRYLAYRYGEPQQQTPYQSERDPDILRKRQTIEKRLKLALTDR